MQIKGELVKFRKKHLVYLDTHQLAIDRRMHVKPVIGLDASLEAPCWQRNEHIPG